MEIEIQEYMKKKKIIQKTLIDYLDSFNNIEENFQNSIELINQLKITENRNDLEEFLHLLAALANFHHRLQLFFEKIEKIIIYLASKIKKYLTNRELFNIFKNNKPILLFLIKNKMITIDSSIAKILIQNENRLFTNYFFNEIKSYIRDVNLYQRISLQNSRTLENFEEKRKIGENDNYICQLIRSDVIDEFISYVNKNLISLQSKIETSIFETNVFIQNHYQSPTLIEYSAFFGSAQIFKYLYLNGVELTKSIWDYAIYGNDEEIIHILENKNIELPMFILNNCIIESIKSHHIHITNYLLQKLNEDEIKKLRNDFYMKRIQELNDFQCFDAFNCYTSIPSFKYFNYFFFPEKLDDPFSFYYLCKYNYINLVKLLLKTSSINVNQRIINYFCINGEIEPIFLNLYLMKFGNFFIL